MAHLVFTGRLSAQEFFWIPAPGHLQKHQNVAPENRTHKTLGRGCSSREWLTVAQIGRTGCVGVSIAGRRLKWAEYVTNRNTWKLSPDRTMGMRGALGIWDILWEAVGSRPKRDPRRLPRLCQQTTEFVFGLGVEPLILEGV